MNAASDERTAKRGKVRKGTHSCWECRRRKVKCTFASAKDTICITCHRRGAKCVGQTDFLVPDNNTNLATQKAAPGDLLVGVAGGNSEPGFGPDGADTVICARSGNLTESPTQACTLQRSSVVSSELLLSGPCTDHNSRFRSRSPFTGMTTRRHGHHAWSQYLNCRRRQCPMMFPMQR